MQRFVFTCAVLAFVQTAYGQRYIAFQDGGCNGTINPHVFELGTSEVGSAIITPWLSVNTPSPSCPAGTSMGAFIRDAMVPEDGIPGVAKRARPVANGSPRAGFMVTHPDNIQFWARVDGESWQQIVHEDNVGFSFNPEPGSGFSVTFWDVGILTAG